MLILVTYEHNLGGGKGVRHENFKGQNILTREARHAKALKYQWAGGSWGWGAAEV